MTELRITKQSLFVMHSPLSVIAKWKGECFITERYGTQGLENTKKSFNMKVGDTIEIRSKHRTELSKITNIGKTYISCGNEYIFLKDTHKCVRGIWEIVGTTEPKPKARPRGRSAQFTKP